MEPSNPKQKETPVSESPQEGVTPGQPVQDVGTSDDRSLDNPDPSVSPTSPEAERNWTEPSEEEGQESILTRLDAASAHLLPSEIPSPDALPRLFAAFVYAVETGDLPKPLHERFPDHYSDPNDNQ